MDSLSDEEIKRQRAQKMQALGQLTGGVAHDINNILAIIEGSTRMLEKQLGPQNPHMERLSAILQATQRGADLTKRLLHFGHSNPMPTPRCDLVASVLENKTLLRPLLSSRIDLVFRLPSQPVWIHCDEDSLTQILINLALNARDAIPHSGTVTIEVLTSSEKAVLAFADTGRGIDPEIMPYIFDPFFTTKTREGGMGLGLSMLHDVMTSLGGTVDARSALGYGTEFSVVFPRVGFQAVPKPELNAVNMALQNKTVLIVDDEEELLPILENQLATMGLKVLKAANADVALLMQENYPEHIDLLLTDVVMPGLNGVRLAEMMCDTRPEMGVVYMTGYTRNPDIINTLAPLPEAALIVPKPLDTNILSDALEQALLRVQQMTASDETVH